MAHHPDGVLWPRQHPGGSEALPVVILEVQICDVTWVDLAVLARQPDLDPLLALLTLPVQKEPDLGPCAQRPAHFGAAARSDRANRAFQDILAEGREEGREEGRRREASTLALRQLERRCGSLEAPTSSLIEAPSLPQLEELALALLDFRNAQDLQTWLEPMEA